MLQLWASDYFFIRPCKIPRMDFEEESKVEHLEVDEHFQPILIQVKCAKFAT